VAGEDDRELPVAASPRDLQASDEWGEDRETIVALFGDSARAGSWLPPELLSAVAVFGNVKLDFTEAELPAGPTQIRGFAVFGNVEIFVPRHLDVELDGVSIFGSIQHRSDRKAGQRLLDRVLGKPAPAAPAAPDDGEDRWLEVKGWAVFGNIKVTAVDS
jgi:hypothetical protein